MKLKIILPVLTSLFVTASVTAWAAGGGDIHAIPIKMIITQALNGIAVVLLLYFLTRKAVKEFFTSRRKEFLKQLQEANRAKETAEKKQQEIKERLAKLKSTESVNMDKARSQAEVLKKTIIAEAKDLSDRLAKESKASAEYELTKAITHLREELYERALEQAKENLKQKVDAPEQQKLRKEFYEKIQVVP